jgi:hypothetical protein
MKKPRFAASPYRHRGDRCFPRPAALGAKELRTALRTYALGCLPCVPRQGTLPAFGACSGSSLKPKCPASFDRLISARRP